MGAILNGIPQLLFAGDVIASGYITGKESGVFAYLPEPSVNTIVEAGTFQAITGTFTNNPIEDFTLVTDKIRYDGYKTQDYVVHGSVNVKADAPLTEVKIGIKINDGTPVTRTVHLFTADEYIPASSLVVAELTKNDTVQLVITSDGTNDEITVGSMSVSINQFFK